MYFTSTCASWYSAHLLLKPNISLIRYLLGNLSAVEIISSPTSPLLLLHGHQRQKPTQCTCGEGPALPVPCYEEGAGPVWAPGDLQTGSADLARQAQHRNHPTKGWDPLSMLTFMRPTKGNGSQPSIFSLVQLLWASGSPPCCIFKDLKYFGFWKQICFNSLPWKFPK